MTTIDRCARAIAEAQRPGTPWERMSEKTQDEYCQAAIACIEALLPVSDAAAEIACTTFWEKGWPHGEGDSRTARGERTQMHKVFTAAITHITKDG